MENNNCIFCKIVKGEIKTELVYEDDNFIAFLDIHPKAEGHTLIVSKKHFPTILDMPSSLGSELLDAIKNVSIDILKKGKAEGFNLIVNNGEAGGQVVNHMHLHILPRKKGDGLKMLV